MRCRCGTASEELASTTDGQPALASAGPTDQVALCRSYPPSFRKNVQGDLDDSTTGCPISRRCESEGRNGSTTPINEECQWGLEIFISKTSIRHNTGQLRRHLLQGNTNARAVGRTLHNIRSWEDLGLEPKQQSSKRHTSDTGRGRREIQLRGASRRAPSIQAAIQAL